MDIVFHRNCLDGAYSAFLMYLFCRTVSKKGYSILLQHLEAQTDHQLKCIYSQQILVNQCPKISEQFFFEKAAQIPFHFVSMFAGDLFPISPSSQGNILFLIDISPNSQQIMINMSQRFRHVVIIDHHTSFQNCLNIIKEKKLKNVYYYWNDKMCATELVQQFLFKGFGFPKNLPNQLQQEIAECIKYVASNDLKKNQNKIAKQFVLGFYYFQIELTHQNPLLFKRLWSTKVKTILSKGQNLYKLHMQCLAHQVSSSQIFTIVKSKYKGMKFLASEFSDGGLTSDLGSILAFLSYKNKMENLAVIYKKGSANCKLSLRSYQLLEGPKALQVSQFYGGGGHLCAAGCSLDKKTFKQHFKLQGNFGKQIKLSQAEIQQILFST